MIKRGSRGARVFARDDQDRGEPPLRFDIATSAIQAEDTTGAGDAFDAGFIAGWLGALGSGHGGTDALHRATIAGHRAAARHLRSPRTGAAARMSPDAPGLSSAQGGVADRLQVAGEVAAALAAGTPVVALESTLISHGLAYPANLEVARASEAAVRECGAVPATVAIRDGRLLVGLADAELEALATAPRGVRAEGRSPEPRRRAGARRLGGDDGLRDDDRGPRRGHPRLRDRRDRRRASARPGPGPSLDISSDLDELARTPMAVVCAGPKAILDVPNTLEVLETRGVPVVAVGQAELPGLLRPDRGRGRAALRRRRGGRGRRSSRRTSASGSGRGSSCASRCRPTRRSRRQVARDAVDRANAEAEAAGIHGPELTPWLLARIAALTDGASVRANTALIVNNARVGGSIGVRARCPRVRPSVDWPDSPTRRRLGEPMRIYEGSPRQDWEEVLRSVGAYLDDRGMRGVVFIETDNGFIIQGTSVDRASGPRPASRWARRRGRP